MFPSAASTVEASTDLRNWAPLTGAPPVYQRNNRVALSMPIQPGLRQRYFRQPAAERTNAVLVPRAHLDGEDHRASALRPVIAAGEVEAAGGNPAAFVKKRASNLSVTTQ